MAHKIRTTLIFAFFIIKFHNYLLFLTEHSQIRRTSNVSNSFSNASEPKADLSGASNCKSIELSEKQYFSGLKMHAFMFLVSLSEKAVLRK